MGGEPWGFLGGALGRGPEASAWEEPWRSLGGALAGSSLVEAPGKPGRATPVRDWLRNRVRLILTIGGSIDVVPENI